MVCLLQMFEDYPDKMNTKCSTLLAKRKSFWEYAAKGNPDHPICPVMLGDAKLASTFANEMFERGIYVIGVWYPVVPKGKARIRVTITAIHTEGDIDRAVDAFVTIGRNLKVIN